MQLGQFLASELRGASRDTQIKLLPVAKHYPLGVRAHNSPASESQIVYSDVFGCQQEGCAFTGDNDHGKLGVTFIMSHARARVYAVGTAAKAATALGISNMPASREQDGLLLFSVPSLTL